MRLSLQGFVIEINIKVILRQKVSNSPDMVNESQGYNSPRCEGMNQSSPNKIKGD